MAQKDITSKALLALPDVFADVVNALLFKGVPIVKEEDLIPVRESSVIPFPVEEELHEQLRDVVMLHKKDGIVYSLFGIENQTTQVDYMPLRVIAYDGAAYKEQVNARLAAKDDPYYAYYPVITLVLNYSSRPWTAPKTLHQSLGIQKGSLLASLVNDYRIPVVDVIFMSEEQQAALKGDFGKVSFILACVRRDVSIKAEQLQFDHPEECGAFLEAHLGVKGLKEAIRLGALGVIL